MIVPALFAGVLVATVAEVPTAAAQVGSTYPRFYVNTTGTTSGNIEPSIEVLDSGTIFVQNSLTTWRSTDGGKVWTRINPQSTGTVTFDPVLVADKETGRLFVDQLYVACSILAFTDNPDTATTLPVDWVTQPAACGEKIGQDHQKLAAGPLPASPELPNTGVYPNAVYYAWSDVGKADFMVARSLDGGLTWVQGGNIAEGIDHRGGSVTQLAFPSGIIHVDPLTGFVYGEWPTIDGDEHWVSVSEDGGWTWMPERVSGAPLPGAGHGGNTDGGLDTDSASNVYVAWWNERDMDVYYSYSPDHGATWLGPTKVNVNYREPANGFDGAGTIRSTIFPTLVAGADGRIAIGYYGTEDGPSGTSQDYHPDDCNTCRWRLYMTTISNADTLLPTIDTYAITDGTTTQSKYAQIGSIHVGGGDDPDRNLLDFIDSDVGPDGWPVFAMTDGCTSAATCVDDAGGATSLFVKATGGFNLYGSDSPSSNPDVKILSPAEGATVPAGSVAVSGRVDRDADLNAAPTASISAAPSSGLAPLAVTFTISASDSDGTIVNWNLDFENDGTFDTSGVGAPPATFSHTYNAPGTYTAKIAVTDDGSTSATATTGTITVTAPPTGIPEPDGTIDGQVQVYDGSLLAIGTGAALVTGAAGLGSTPQYPVGEPVTFSVRFATSQDPAVPVSTSTDVRFEVWRVADATKVATHETTGYADEGTAAAPCAGCVGFDTDIVQIPSDWSGEYDLVPIAKVAGLDHAIAVLRIRIIGAAPPPPPGSDPGPSDDGHSIADVDNDAKSPQAEIQWADVALTPTSLNVAFQLKDVHPLGAGDSPWTYVAWVNGVNIETYILEGVGVWDNTNGQKAGDSTAEWDTAAKQVRVSIDRAYLEAIGADCPCTLFLESRYGEGQAGGQVVDDRAPSAGNVAVSAKPTGGLGSVIALGSQGDPELEDEKDNDQAYMDVRKVWISGETPTSVDITMQLEDLSSQPPSVDVGLAKAAVNYGLEFCTDNNLNSASSDGLFCWRLSAVNGLPAPRYGAGVIQRDGTGSCGFADLLLGGAFNVAADTVTWKLDRAKFNVKQNSADVQSCQTTPPVRGGAGLVDGTTLSALEASTGASAGAGIILTLNIGDTANGGRDYEFGNVAVPLDVDAGGPYSGTLGAQIPIGASPTGGSAPYACAWSGAGATFADAASCATTVSFAAAGTHSVSVQVTDAASATDSDTASVVVTGAAVERVSLFVDAETTARATVAVTTSASSPAASWDAVVDLSGLSGSHALVAKWFDADGRLLDSHTVNVAVVSSGGATVAITSPAHDPAGASPVSGTITLAGTAGHEAGSTGVASGAGDPLRLRETFMRGNIQKACKLCGEAPSTLAQTLGNSLSWSQHAPDSRTDGRDGRWFDVAGYAGSEYRLETRSGERLNAYFFADVDDPQRLATGSNVGPALVKTGTIPAGSAWAFVYKVNAGSDEARLTITTQTGTPSLPNDLVATAVAHGVSLDWGASEFDGGSPILAYEVLRDGAVVGKVPAGVTAFTDVGLAAGAERAYTVRAVNANGAGTLSKGARATPLSGADTTAPGAVPDVAAATSGDAATLTWGAATDDVGVVAYRVFRGGAGVTPATGLLIYEGAALTASDTLAAGETARYVVVALDAANNAGPAGAPAVATAPDAVSETVTLTLDGTEIATIAVDTSAGDAAWQHALDTTTLADGFHVLVADFDDGAGGSASATSRFAVQNHAAIAITAPADGATVGVAFSVEGTASPGPGATGAITVDVRVLDSGDAPVMDWTRAAFANGAFDAAVSGLAPGATYTIEARIREDVTTLATDSITVTVLNNAPVADAGVDRTVDEGTPVALSATATDADGHAVRFAWEQTSGPSVPLAGADSQSATFTAPQLDADATLGFEVTVTDEFGATGSDSVLVTVKDLDEIAVETVKGVPVEDVNRERLVGTVVVTGRSHLANGGAANEPPTAVISDFVVNGMTVAASGALSTDVDGDIVSYAWDLGNGDTRSGDALAYEYPLEGSYRITLRVTDDAGAADDAMTDLFAVDRVDPPSFVADAGDSVFVKAGDDLALAGNAFGATGAVTYAWDVTGDDIADVVGQSALYDTTGLAPGARTVKLFATDATGAQATDTVQVLLYEIVTVRTTFENDVLLGIPDEGSSPADAGLGGTVDGATFEHTLPVAAGATKIHAYLDWEFYAGVIPENPTGLVGGPSDFDLYAISPDGSQNVQSADFDRPEEVTIFSPVPGAWKFRVVSYVAADEHYTLDVDLDTAPTNPIPRLTQESDTCQESATQTVAVGVTGATTGAWDLDLDGAFDDATGLTASTSYPLDGVARLLRFRATSDDGYRESILVALRPSADCGTAPAVVTVAIADTGINPYSKDYAGELVPYPELREMTTANPSDLGPGDTLVYHKVTGELLPFTKHPSSYIPGFPEDAEALVLTVGGGYYKSLDDTRVWSKGHAAIPLNKWFWVPGTKLIGAIDTSDTAAINSAADATPLWDDDGHGSGSASVAVGNLYGTCPRCLLVFAESLSGDSAFFSETWIDFVSVSGGSLGNVGVPDAGQLGFGDTTKAATERGQTIAYAAGNGNANAYESPEQTYTGDNTGPHWLVTVGAVSKGSDSSILTSGKTVDWSSYGSGPIQATCRNNYQGNCGHSGTSAATPISTGVMANTLLNARIALNDGDAGQKTPAQANGKRAAVAVGTPVADSPWLADGVLTRPELWRVSWLCASQLGTSVGYPGSGPRSAADHVYAGYGIADAAAALCASNAVVTGAATPDRAAADAFMDVDEQIRKALWGDWDGDADGAEGGNERGTFRVALPDLAEADVDTVDEATALLAEKLAGTASPTPPVTETYYLHRTACAGGTDPVFMDRTPAVGEEAGHGCAGATTNLDEAWASTVPTDAAFATGALVRAFVHGFTLAPNPEVTMRATLLANGVAVGTGTATSESLSLALVTTPCAEWAFSFVTTADVPAGATLTLAAETDPGTGDVAMCYEGGFSGPRMSITGSGDVGGDTPVATITAPSQGTEFESTGTVAIEGTATFPARAASQRLYLRRDACANAADPMYLSPVDATDAGNGCAIIAGATAPVNPFVETYDLIDTELPVTLARGGTVSGKIYVATQGADPFELEFRVVTSAGVAGSQVVTGTAAEVLGAPRRGMEVPFSFAVADATAGLALTSLAFEIEIRQQGAVHWTSLDSPASFIEIPRAVESDTGREVQVAVNDPTFATGRLAVTGTSTWSAAWSVEDLEPGSYTLYARAGQDGEFGAATSVGVLVKEPEVVGRTAAVQVQAVDKDAALAPDGWVAATLDAETGDWTFDWDTTVMTNGPVEFHARLLGDGVEAARDTFTGHVNNPRPPKMHPIGPKSAMEDEAVTFAVTGEDSNGDALTYSASGMPEGATFENNEFSWQTDFLDAGAHTVTFTVSDGTGSDSEAVTITVFNVNRPVTLDAIGGKLTDEGASLAFTVTATDPDTDDTLTFAADTLPAGATFDSATGAFAWTPDFTQAGDYAVRFTATDGATSDFEDVTIRVANVNTAPVLAAIGAQSLAENAPFTLTLSATDGEGDALSFTATGMPAGATLDGATLAWTPTFDDAGVHTVTFTVSDGQLTDSETVTLTVANVNRAPLLAAIGARTVAEDATLTVTPTGSDPDGDAVTFSATGLPSGATFASGTLTWKPSFTQAGTYTVKFTASDGTLSASEDVTITVTNTNRAPTVSFTAPATVRAGASASFTVTKSDPDGDALASAWSFGDGTTSTAASPTKAWSAGGVYTVTLVVTDAHGATATATRVVTVDALAPTSTVIITGTQTSDGWYDESVRVRFSATDATAGVKHTKYGFDAAPNMIWNGNPLQVPGGETTRTVKFASEDNVGNVEATQTATIRIDTVAPTVRLNLTHPVDVIVAPATLVATADDAGTGVAYVEFAVDQVVVCTDSDGSDGWTCEWTPDVTDSGRHAIAAFAYDRLGHRGADSVNAVVVGAPGEVPVKDATEVLACAERLGQVPSNPQSCLIGESTTSSPATPTRVCAGEADLTLFSSLAGVPYRTLRGAITAELEEMSRLGGEPVGSCGLALLP